MAEEREPGHCKKEKLHPISYQLHCSQLVQNLALEPVRSIFPNISIDTGTEKAHHLVIFYFVTC